MKLSQIDLNLLVALDALLRERNVTRAGRHVGRSQPAMSAALGRLRHLFGDPLLVRVGREYHLTPRASDLAVQLQATLNAIERTLAPDAEFDPKTAQVSFRVAASDYAEVVLLQRLLQRLSREAPGVRLRFQPLTNDIQTQLAVRHLDLSLQPIGAMPGFETQNLFSDTWVCAAWRGNSEIGDTLTMDQFRSLPRLAYVFSRGGMSLADRHINAAGTMPPKHVTSQSFISLPFLLQGTRMFALIPSRLAQRLCAAAEMRVLEPPMAIPGFVEQMWWNPLYTTDPAHAWLRTVMTEVAATI